MEEENHDFFFGFNAREELEKKENFYDQIQDILNKTNKHDYTVTFF